ncbi:beta-1,3-galactosyltransferase brn-like [Argopecten irradians]|uniref:beta-1,3-galactosyltransferase brn-like n=1 Tax=Argopecten irradians TaxID=31199 RepID=UPI00370FFF94
MTKKRRCFYIIIIVFPLFFFYVNIFKFGTQTQKYDLNRFDIKIYTKPLTFDIRDVIDRHLYNNNPLPSTIVNPHPYHYRYSPLPCNQYSDKSYIPVLVKSFVGSIELREVLRQLADRMSAIRLVFMLGFREEYVDRISKEYETYKDLIQEDFIDVYRNNTLKTIMGFNWATEYCPEAKLLLFIDDDFLVHWTKMVSFLSRFKDNSTNLFFGKRVSDATPERDKQSAWYVDSNVYPFKTYPAYIAGGVFVVSRDVSRKFKMAFPYVKYIGVDDVYLGIVSNILGIKPSYCAELARRDRLSLAVECSHIPSELATATCQTKLRIPMELLTKEMESVTGKFIYLTMNAMKSVEMLLSFLQYILTFGQL